MWAFLNHPLIVTLIGVAIAGVLVPYFARRWQDRQKALDVRVTLITDMSQASMGLMARFETVLNLAESADDSGALGRAWDDLKAERQKFEVREAVIGTKLEVYLKSPAIAQRWDKLAEAMTGLVELRGSDAAHDAGHREPVLRQLAEAMTGLVEREGSDAAHDAEHRERVLRQLAVAMTGLVEREGSDAAHDAEHREQMLQKVLRQLEKLSAVPVDGQAWRDVYDAILERKAALIHGVLREPMVFRTSWIPWGR